MDMDAGSAGAPTSGMSGIGRNGHGTSCGAGVEDVDDDASRETASDEAPIL